MTRYLLLYFSTLTIFMTTGCRQEKYTSGRDTIESFGDGRFQLLKTVDGVMLMDLETQKTLSVQIVGWRKKGDWVYTLSKNKKYTILNYRDGFYETVESIEKARLENQEELRKLR